MLYDYSKCRIAKACLELAEKSKSNIGFGAVLVKNNKIIGRGWNRLSTKEERAVLSHVDYCVHAEQSSVYDAISKRLNITNSRVYVLGKVLKGELKGRLTHRDIKGFGCIKCPHTFIKYKIPVYVSLLKGWVRIEPEESLVLGKQVCGKNMWNNFTRDNKFKI